MREKGGKLKVEAEEEEEEKVKMQCDSPYPLLRSDPDYIEVVVFCILKRSFDFYIFS